MNHKLITVQDFVKAEIDKWGFDYVDDLFNRGYEPALVNSKWCWLLKGTQPRQAIVRSL